MANLFKQAESKSAPKKEKPKKEEIIISNKDFYTTINRVITLKQEVDERIAELKLKEVEIKDEAINQFKKKYITEKKNPGSFIIKAQLPGKPVAEVMLIPTDKYSAVGKDRADELIKTYGDKIITKTTTYEMNSKLVEEYGDILSDLITKCKQIPAEAKENLINAVVTYEVKKGTIDELHTYKSIDDVVMDINPQFQLKSYKVM